MFRRGSVPLPHRTHIVGGRGSQEYVCTTYVESTFLLKTLKSFRKLCYTWTKRLLLMILRADFCHESI